jgi:hypothetical protein
MRYRARPFLSLLVLVSYLSACTSWQVQTAPASSVLTKYAGKDVRVTTVGGQRTKIRQPTISGDSLIGRGRDTTAVAIPLSEVREVAVKRTSVTRTALLIVGVGAVAGAAALVAICADVCDD